MSWEAGCSTLRVGPPALLKTKEALRLGRKSSLSLKVSPFFSTLERQAPCCLLIALLFPRLQQLPDPQENFECLKNLTPDFFLFEFYSGGRGSKEGEEGVPREEYHLNSAKKGEGGK